MADRKNVVTGINQSSEEYYAKLNESRNKISNYQEPVNKNGTEGSANKLTVMFRKVFKISMIVFAVLVVLLLVIIVGVIAIVVKEYSTGTNSSGSTRSSPTTRFSEVPQCGPGLWHLVGLLNMSDLSQQCPAAWREEFNPARSCRGRSGSGQNSVYYNALGFDYSRICGRITGYLTGTPEAFTTDNTSSINDNYVDGVMVSYGSSRNHVWTLAAAENPSHCPCETSQSDQEVVPLPPSFVGENYFCDSSINGALWDGEGCTTDCCSFNSPPWFSVQLSNPTKHDVEVQIATDEQRRDETIFIRLIQLYVQ